MPDPRVNIRLTATNNASAVIGTVNRDLGVLKQNAGTFEGGGGGLDLGAGGVAMGVIGAVAGGAAAFGAVGKIGAESEALRLMFEQNATAAGTSADAILDAMKEASGGTVAEYELMLAANRAMKLGVADSVSEFVALVEAAKAGGREMGLPTTQALDSLLLGLGRASAEILDNVGISLRATEVFNNYAESIGKVSDELTQEERTLALVTAVMEKFEGTRAIESSLDDYERLNAEASNLWANLGSGADMVSGPVVGAAASALGTVNEEIEFLGRSTVEMEADLQRVGTALETAEMRFGQAKTLMQSGVSTPEVMTEYNAALQELNRLWREQDQLQRQLEGSGNQTIENMLGRAEAQQQALESQMFAQPFVGAGVGAWATQLTPQIEAAKEAQAAMDAFRESERAFRAEMEAAPAEQAEPSAMFAGVQEAAASASAAAEASFAGIQAAAAGKVAEVRGALAAATRETVSSNAATMTGALGNAAATYVPGMGAIGTDAGTEFASNLVGAIGARMASFSASGATAGAAWKAAFLSAAQAGLPGALADSVAQAVTPRVESNIRTQGSLRGAQ